MNFVYLAALIVSLTGMAAIDWRLSLACRTQPLRTVATLVLSVLFFLMWDAFGISLGIFFKGQSQFLTGIVLAPELPLEEPLFLGLLSYCALLLVLGFQRRMAGKWTT
jgi:lycopene cyclase domain-containing protein